MEAPRELLQELVREHPSNFEYLYNLALIQRSLSIASDASGQPAGAETTRRSAQELEERLIRERPESNAYYYDVAQSYISCSTTLVPTASGAVDHTTFAESCGGFALGMLLEAERAGYFSGAEGVELLKNDNSLNPIRSRVGFRQLLAHVLAASAPQAK